MVWGYRAQWTPARRAVPGPGQPNVIFWKETNPKPAKHTHTRGGRFQGLQLLSASTRTKALAFASRRQRFASSSAWSSRPNRSRAVKPRAAMKGKARLRTRASHEDTHDARDGVETLTSVTAMVTAASPGSQGACTFPTQRPPHLPREKLIEG